MGEDFDERRPLGSDRDGHGRQGGHESLAAVLERLRRDRSQAADAELRALITVSATVAGAHRIDDVLAVTARESRRALGAASVSIRRLDPRRRLQTLVTAAAPGSDRRADDGREHELDVPIVFEDRPWGSLCAAPVAGELPLGARQRRFLEVIADQLAVALGRSELFSRIAALAFEDPLTGLANRRALDESVEAVVDRAREVGSDVSLLFCDVDRLKEINDSFGHDAGDRALVDVAEVLSSVADGHPGSLVARIGGDEFCVVLSGAPVQAAKAMARRASDLLAEVGPPAVTLSSGAASLRSGARDAADLFRAADTAQYAAKRAGRGGVFVAGADAGEAGLGERTALGRRALRDRHASELQRQLGVTTALLDEVLAGAPVLDRLEAVAEGLAQTLDVAEWGISFVPAAGAGVSLLRAGYRRDPDAPEEASRLEGRVGEDAYGVGDFPLIARLVVRGGAGAVAVDDPSAEEVEVAFLEEWGYSGVLAAAGLDDAGTYVVELFADERTLELGPATAQLRLLVLAAVSAASTRVSQP